MARSARAPLQVVSPLGWTVLGMALVAGGVGWWLGWAELTAVGATLGAALLAAAALTLGRSAYAVRLELSDGRVTVGQRAVGRLEVRNTSRRRLLPAGIELPVGHGAADLHLPSLGPGAVHEDVFAMPTTRRAVVAVGPVRSVRGDPWGLLRRRVRWTDTVDLYVHPRLVPLSGAASGVLRDLEGQATRLVSDSDLSLHALREYVPGDDRRHIHWRSSARVGELMVRQFEDVRRTHTAVAVSTSSDDYAGVDEFELAVAVAASIGAQALRDERDLTVLAGDGRLRTQSPAALLDDVCGLELSGQGRGAGALAPWVTREAREASVVVLVTGSLPSRADLRGHGAHLPAGTRALVLVCHLGAPVEVLTHGSLSLAQVGSLHDLPRALRRMVTG